MFKLTLQKTSQRRLNKEVCLSQFQYGIDRALEGGRGRLWSAGVPRITEKENGDLTYTATVTFKRTGRGAPLDTLKRQFEYMQYIAAMATRGKGWLPPDQINATPSAFRDEKPEVSKHYASIINTDPGDNFSHLYERDSQVEIILSAVREYANSSFNNRFHAVLYGEPACGKTDILRSLTKMVGSEAVLHFDATSTTKAGAQKVLLETKDVPPILCIEEIEKTDESSLRWLLGILDYRSEIRKTTNRGSFVKEVKLLCLATVNDYRLFNSLMDGALASRFSHKIYCPRPSKEVLTQILLREVIRSGGDERWIAPAIDWCVEVEKTNDPRRLITICMSGREKLITGEYQQHLKATMPPVEAF